MASLISNVDNVDFFDSFPDHFSQTSGVTQLFSPTEATWMVPDEEEEAQRLEHGHVQHHVVSWL